MIHHPSHLDAPGKLVGRLLVVAAALMWSTSGLFAKAPYFDVWPEDVRGPLLAFWRAAFATLVLVPLVRRPRWTPLLVPMTVAFTVWSVLVCRIVSAVDSLDWPLLPVSLVLPWFCTTNLFCRGWASENWSMNNVSLRTLAKGVRRMKGKRRTTEEKIRILRQADGERTILEICAENNISEQTFHRWKKEFGLLDVKQAKRLKELEAENTSLKRIVADQVLGMEIIQEALEKKL